MSAGKLVSAALVFIAFTLYGAVRTSKQNGRLNLLMDICSDIGEIESRLSITKSPLPDIAEVMAVVGACPKLWGSISEGMRKGYSFRQAYEEADRPCFGTEEAEVLAELARKLGTCNLESECRRLRFTCNKLTTLHGELTKKVQAGAKLNGSLSVLCGLAAALLIL